MAVSGKKSQNVKKLPGICGITGYNKIINQGLVFLVLFPVHSFFLVDLGLTGQFNKRTRISKNVIVDVEELNYDSICSQSVLRGCFSNAKLVKTGNYFASFRRFCIFDYCKLCQIKKYSLSFGVAK